MLEFLQYILEVSVSTILTVGQYDAEASPPWQINYGGLREASAILCSGVSVAGVTDCHTGPAYIHHLQYMEKRFKMYRLFDRI